MLRKLSIIFIRLAPVLLAIKILVLLLAEYFVVSSLLIGLVSSITDLLIAIGLLILSLTLVQGYIDNKIEVLKAIRLLSNVYHVKTIKLNELQNSDKYVSFENIFPDCELSSPYAHGCQTDITHYFDSLSLMHDIQILLKRSCFLVEPSKTATFSDLVKVVGKRIKNEKHKFGVLYENGKLESHWLTNEEINNKTR